tara:strand:- start:1299 stop:2003 length:705 start_codon:yes stop_codon:yes gene_type:complete
MEYSRLTTSNKNLIKRFSHSKRFEIASNLIEKYDPKTFLDYGAGDGELVKYLLNIKKKNIYLFEPNSQMRISLENNLINHKIFLSKIFKDRTEIYQNFFDVISINEVFEHLTFENSIKILKNLKKIGKSDVKLIISVPIEVGLASLFKNSIRIITKQTHEGTNLKNIVKSFFHMNIERPNIDYNNSHIGFNYKYFLNFLDNQNLKIKNLTFSPYNFLGRNLSSQIFVEAIFNDQ